MEQDFIKVLGLRFVPDKKTEKLKESGVFFDKPYNFKDHQTLFNSLESFIASLPESERFNLHYTLHHLPPEAKSRSNMSRLTVIPFDIDMIDQTKKNEYITLFEDVIGISRNEMAVVDSGFGMHILYETSEKIYTKKDIQEIRASYDSLCDLLTTEMDKRGLVVDIFVPHKDGVQTTHIDKQVFRAGTLRLPNTKNVKFDKEMNILAEAPVKFITRTMVPKTLAQLKLSRAIKDTAGVLNDTSDRDYWGKTDSKFVMENCGALKFFKEQKGNVSYPQWLSAASVIGRFNDVDGRAMFHELSSGHPNYTYEETEKLLDSVLSSGGPHKCTTFARYYDQCKDCKLKCSSPISLRGKTYLSLEDTGFHYNSNGKWFPSYKQILTKIGQECNYKLIAEKSLFRYEEDKNMWVKWPNMYIRNYITKLLEKKPDDIARTNVINEIYGLMSNRNPADDFLSTSAGKINFQNGWGEFKEGDFMFTPHGPLSHTHNFTYCLDFEYDNEAKAPLFEEFLNDISLGRENIILFLKQYIGYILSNDTCWAEKGLLMKGRGANGKSVLIDVLKKMIGKDNYSIVNLRNIKNVEARAALVGKVANLSDESPKDALTDNEDFKLLVSGGEFEYRVLYEGLGKAINRAKFVFSTNHDLSITEKSTAVGRRLIVIPFDACFQSRTGKVDKPADPFIREKLYEECAGIFNMCMKEYIKAKKKKAFDIPQESDEILEEMESSGNLIKYYVDEQVNIGSFVHVAPDAEIDIYGEEIKVGGPLIYVPLGVLYADFIAFCEDNGSKAQYTKMGFARQFASHMSMYLNNDERKKYIGRQIRVNKKRVRVYALDWTPFQDIEL